MNRPSPTAESADDAVIECRGLKKSFGRNLVLDGVDLKVPRGSIFGFLGLNGAGKSTTIRILLGLLRPGGGECRVVGLNPVAEPIAVRQRVGYMAESQTMYGWMRVRELIWWCGSFYPTWDFDLAGTLSVQMQLSLDAKVGTLSKGQTSKLALLLALAQQPELVVLDDPVLGLDPLARRDFLRDVVGQLQGRGVTVFFSSHLLYEIEPICDYVAILHGGRIVASERVDDLRGRVKRLDFHLKPTAGLGDIPGLLDCRREGELCSVVTTEVIAATAALKAVSEDGVTTCDLNLDEIFEAFVAGRKEIAS